MIDRKLLIIPPSLRRPDIDIPGSGSALRHPRARTRRYPIPLLQIGCATIRSSRSRTLFRPRLRLRKIFQGGLQLPVRIQGLLGVAELVRVLHPERGQHLVVERLALAAELLLERAEALDHPLERAPGPLLDWRQFAGFGIDRSPGALAHRTDFAF